jgi:adenylosuccinate synthase
MPGMIIVGVQWGDEGKGKMIDIFSERADCVVRSHGGNNAGHTVLVNGKEYKFHLIPSGVLYPHVECFITGGTVIDLSSLIEEIKMLEKEGISLRKRLHISSFAHIIFPYHSLLDLSYEKLKKNLAIGTTGKGIGPCYADKVNRIGIQVGELLNFAKFSDRLRQVVAIKNKELVEVFQLPPINVEELLEDYKEKGEMIRPYITIDAERRIFASLEKNKKVLFEGAHGSYLDQTFGTYPYVTSSSTLAAGVACGAAIGPSKIDHVLAVVKAYTTRVGHGPFPTELTQEEKSLFLSNKVAREIGTTTGRDRRMGWFDAPLVKQSLQFNGADSMAVMKLDVLDSLESIRLCTGYLLDGDFMDLPPPMTTDWERLQPVYEELPGWKRSTRDIFRQEDLPKEAKKYLERVQHFCNCPISSVSYGPERDKIFHVNTLFS